MNRAHFALVDACRVPSSVREREVGAWTLVRHSLSGLPEELGRSLRRRILGDRWDSWTTLHRTTLATLMNPVGECVMDDGLLELRRHLPFLIAASGRVLVSGLGLGCVVRGLLSKPDVEHVDVVEIDPAILRLIGHEFANEPRVTLHLGDALRIDWPAGTRWRFAWHDVWDEHEALPIVHARILARYVELADRQGCWDLPRDIERIWPTELLGASRRVNRRKGGWSRPRVFPVKQSSAAEEPAEELHEFAAVGSE